ncbi:MAG: hypothetical protein U9N57_05465 [Pseudomonadota bacterium]|nr:hypothetical protein [Pseudomonadota bacterium]
MFSGSPNIIDIEASGFGYDSYPIEVGIILRSGERYCSLIKPHETWTYWDKSAEKIHQISQQKLQTYGKPIEVIVEELNDFLGKETVYTDGWVVDDVWIKKLFFTANKSLSFSVSSLEMILTEAQMNIWHTTKDKLLQGSEEQRHRASFDAALIQQTFIETAQKPINQ